MTRRFTSWPTAESPPGIRWNPEPGPRGLTRELLTRWEAALGAWDAPGVVNDALGRLTDPDTLVVVTGQQPGPGGGPIYSLYKAATAVAATRRMERETGRPGVAVFWMGADDADWDEVAWLTLPRPDRSLFRHRWDSPLPSTRSWVGSARVDLPAEARNLLDASPSLVVADGDGDLGDRFAAYLLERLGESGLLVLDARWPEVRRAGAPLWSRYLDEHRIIAEALDDRGRELAEGGDSPPIGPGETDRGLFLIDEEHRLEPTGDWEHEARRRLADDGGAGLAPSVLLRAPLQDHLLGSSAQIVGRGEATYLAQLGPVYRALGIREPARTPRLHATLIPGGPIPPDRVADAVEEPESVVAELAGARVPADLRGIVATLRDTARRDLERFTTSGRAFGRELDDLGVSAGRKIDRELGRLADALDRRGRRSLYAEHPELRHLPEFLRPRRTPQDRGLSGWSLDLLLGAEAPELVLRAADLHLERLAEGAVHHLALEIEP